MPQIKTQIGLSSNISRHFISKGTVDACERVGVEREQERHWCCHSVATMLKAAHIVAHRVKVNIYPLNDPIFTLWKMEKNHMVSYCLLALEMSPFDDMKLGTIISITESYQALSQKISGGNSLFWCKDHFLKGLRVRGRAAQKREMDSGGWNGSFSQQPHFSICFFHFVHCLHAATYPFTNSA